MAAWSIAVGVLLLVVAGALMARVRRPFTAALSALLGAAALGYAAWTHDAIRAQLERLRAEFAENQLQGVAILGTALVGTGLWLLLPRGGAAGRKLGLLLAALGLGLLASLGGLASSAAPIGGLVDELVFWTIAVLTVGAAVCTVTFRNPVYSAIWFAIMLLGTAGMFLFLGAQFLAVATIVVYAGAILVTFLFVLMLANPKGHAFYDRLSWEPMLSSGAGAVLLGIVTMTLATALLAPVGEEQPTPPPSITAEQRQGEVLAGEHMAHLGRVLFSRHLVGVEVAGALLLVALVGSVAILAEPPKQPERSHDEHE